MSEDRAIVSQDLPPLPVRHEVRESAEGNLWEDVYGPYSADEMQAYARTAVEAAILKERERAAAITDGIRTLDEVDAAVAAIRARK